MAGDLLSSPSPNPGRISSGSWQWCWTCLPTSATGTCLSSIFPWILSALTNSSGYVFLLLTLWSWKGSPLSQEVAHRDLYHLCSSFALARQPVLGIRIFLQTTGLLEAAARFLPCGSDTWQWHMAWMGPRHGHTAGELRPAHEGAALEVAAGTARGGAAGGALPAAPALCRPRPRPIRSPAPSESPRPPLGFPAGGGARPVARALIGRGRCWPRPASGAGKAPRSAGRGSRVAAAAGPVTARAPSAVPLLSLGAARPPPRHRLPVPPCASVAVPGARRSGSRHMARCSGGAAPKGPGPAAAERQRLKEALAEQLRQDLDRWARSGGREGGGPGGAGTRDNRAVPQAAGGGDPLRRDLPIWWRGGAAAPGGAAGAGAAGLRSSGRGAAAAGRHGTRGVTGIPAVSARPRQDWWAGTGTTSLVSCLFFFPSASICFKAFPGRGSTLSLPLEFTEDFSVTSFFASTFVLLLVGHGCTFHLSVLFYGV